MANFENIFAPETKVLLIDDSISELNGIQAADICPLNPFGTNKDALLHEIITNKIEYLPVIGASMKYCQNDRRTSYEGIKLLLELSGHYSNTQCFVIMSFERQIDLEKREFGYIFNASNIKLISYDQFLND